MIKILTGHDFNKQLYEDYTKEQREVTIGNGIDYNYTKNRYVHAANKFFELDSIDHTGIECCADFINVTQLFNLVDYKNKKICLYKPLGDCHPIFQAKFARIVCELHQKNNHSFTIVTNAMNFFTEIRRCIACGIIKVEDVKVIQYWKFCDLIPMTKHGEIDYFKTPDASQKLFDGDLTCDQLSDIILPDEDRKKYPIYSLLDCIMDNKKVDVHPSSDLLFSYHSSRK